MEYLPPREKNYAARGIAAGTVISSLPVIGEAAASIISMRLEKGGEEEGENLKLCGGTVTDSSGSEIVLNSIDFSDSYFSCRKNGEYFSSENRQMFDELKKRFGDYGAREIFWKCFENSLSPSDIKLLSKKGINCIRIPLRSFLVFRNENIKKEDPLTGRLDSLLKACKKYNVYIIPVLTDIPGDQSLDDKRTRAQIVRIWKKLSGCLYNKSAVAGYEILDCVYSSDPAYGKICEEVSAALKKAGDSHILFFDGADKAGSENCLPPLNGSDYTFKGVFPEKCMFCKSFDTIDSAIDSYETITESLSESMKTGNYQESQKYI